MPRAPKLAACSVTLTLPRAWWSSLGRGSCECLLVLKQQALVDRWIARLRQREMCADPLVAEHVDLDRQPLVEKFLVIDAEVDVDQRLLPAVLAISRRIRLEESTRCDRRAVGQQLDGERSRDVEPVDVLDPHRNRGRALDRERTRGIDASDLVFQGNLRPLGLIRDPE